MDRKDGEFFYNEDELMADTESRYRLVRWGSRPPDPRPHRKPNSKWWLLKRKLTTTQGRAIIVRKTQARIKRLWKGKT